MGGKGERLVLWVSCGLSGGVCRDCVVYGKSAGGIISEDSPLQASLPQPHPQASPTFSFRECLQREAWEAREGVQLANRLRHHWHLSGICDVAGSILSSLNLCILTHLIFPWTVVTPFYR